MAVDLGSRLTLHAVKRGEDAALGDAIAGGREDSHGHSGACVRQ